MITDIHSKDFALRLVLKERLRTTRKWPIACTLFCSVGVRKILFSGMFLIGQCWKKCEKKSHLFMVQVSVLSDKENKRAKKHGTMTEP